MTSEERFLRLRSRIMKQAWRMLYVRRNHLGGRACPWMFEDVMGVCEVAFCDALANRHKARIPLDDWILLCCHNAASNYLQSESRYRARCRSWDVERLALLTGRHDRTQPPELSEDGRTVLEAFSSLDLEAARGLLYAVLGWRRTWQAIEELKEVFS